MQNKALPRERVYKQHLQSSDMQSECLGKRRHERHKLQRLTPKETAQGGSFLFHWAVCAGGLNSILDFKLCMTSILENMLVFIIEMKGK